MEPAPNPPTHGPSAFFARLATRPGLKGAGLTAGFTVFFAAYFAVLKNPAFPVATIPLTPADRWIGFHPWALGFYVSLWPYVTLLPALLTRRGDLLRYALAASGLSLAGLAVFFFWPTAIPPADIDWTRHASLAFLKTVDASGNACPSLHVAFAVFTAWGLDRLARSRAALRAGNVLWAALIVYSTLATRQHVALDVIAGAFLGAAAAAAADSFHAASARPAWTALILAKLLAFTLWLAGMPPAGVLPVFLAGHFLMLYHLFVPGAQGLVRVFTRFETPRREIWLTIDDGPDPEDTPRLLELLDRHRAKATFFVIGARAARHPELIALIKDRGHEIAHHTQTHPEGSFWCASPARLNRELDEALAVLGGQGVRPRFFRAPVGIKNLFLGRALAGRNLACVGWSVRSGDSFAPAPGPVVAGVLRHLRPGAIVLCHEGPRLASAVRVAAIAGLLEALAARDYRCVLPAPEQLR